MCMKLRYTQDGARRQHSPERERGIIGIRAYSRVQLFLEGAAFLKRKTPLLWPIRDLVGEKLSDGAPKDQISVLAYPNILSRVPKQERKGIK